MKEGFPETAILMPLGMGRQTSPLGCPVTDHFKVFCRGCSREMRNPCIDPPDGIRNIGAIDRDLVTDEEIFGDILFDPFCESNLLLNAPSAISNRPDLLRGFRYRLAERGSGEEDEKEQNKKEHISY
jgi:hypothetical protein